MPKAAPLNYKPQLDSLRAIAALAVMAEHFPEGDFVSWNVFQLGYLGLLGVLLFFVLSGYLITGILLSYRSSGVGQAFKRFYIRRTLRIFPIYHLTLVILFLIGLPSVTGYILWHAFYVSNLLFVLKPEIAAPIAHLWTLSVEEQFYLIWPFFILLLPYRHLFRVILWAVVFGLGWKALMIETLGDHLAGGLWVFSCLDSLALGAFLAYVEQDEKLRPKRPRILSGLLLAGSVMVAIQAILFISDTGKGFTLVVAYFGPSLVFTWLVGRAASGFTKWPGAVLNWRPLRYLGKISYGVYLYHYFMPQVLQVLVQSLGFHQPGNLTATLVAFLLTLSAATVSWHLVERPISRLKDQLSKP